MYLVRVCSIDSPQCPISQAAQGQYQPESSAQPMLYACAPIIAITDPEAFPGVSPGRGLREKGDRHDDTECTGGTRGEAERSMSCAIEGKDREHKEDR